jgi:hypothetical protein
MYKREISILLEPFKGVKNHIFHIIGFLLVGFFSTLQCQIMDYLFIISSLNLKPNTALTPFFINFKHSKSRSLKSIATKYHV